MLVDVVAARPLGKYRVHVEFEDGVQGDVDLADVISFEGVFAPLKDPARFAELSVNADLGTICWPNGADLAPERLRELVRVPA